jgi:chromosome segregation ATPase
MPGLSYQKTVSYCELLSSTLKPLLETMPHLQEESESLDELIAELKGLDTQQQALKGRLQEITHLRQVVERRGQALRSRIAAQLQGKLGFTNENLISFGINPRKAGRRRKGPAAGAKKDAAQGTAAVATTTAA